MRSELLVFGEDWGKHPSSTQHLIKHMMEHQQVLWVNSLGLRRPRINRHDICRAWNKLCAIYSSAKAVQPSADSSLSPQLIQPRVIPWPGNSIARSLNRLLLKYSLKPLLNQRSKLPPVIWTSLPSAVDAIGQLGERAVVYYCGDDFSSLAGVDHQPVTEMESELVAKADLIIAASDRLAEKFPAEKTVVLPHGVDCKLFGTAVLAAKDLPTGPVAGFYGSIASWLDQQLLIETARLLPDWTFVLIGPVQCDISRLKQQRNIRLLGPRPHETLPGYSQHWDVGLLPFLKNGQIEACNPLKLREYFAAGSPVVSTRFPALEGYRDLLFEADDAEGFATAIRLSRKLSSSSRQLRQQRVASEDWRIKAEQLQELIDDL